MFPYDIQLQNQHGINAPSILTSACMAQSIPHPVIFGTEILDVSANLIVNYSTVVSERYNFNHGAVTVSNVDYCNVTITYTHPGQYDKINTEIWLPMDTWNGKLQGVGGGGWVAGRFFLSYQSMAGAIGEGYAAVTTDAGISNIINSDVVDWGWVSPGNVNLYALQNLASASLNESAYMAKAVTESMYGKAPTYSYFSGCSQGGRQGMMLAQRYPDAYDGIVASAPAINWNEFIIGDYWGQLVMNVLKEHPRNCELDAISAAAVSFCDPLDGVRDGIISDIDTCDFDPFTVVGTVFNCTDTGLNMEISRTAAMIVNETWAGARASDGSSLWYAPLRGAALTGGSDTVVDTICNDNNTCTGSTKSLLTDWIKVFVLKNVDFDVDSLDYADFESVFHAGVQQFASIIGTSDPDLSEFKARGGKILSYHGLVRPWFPFSLGDLSDVSRRVILMSTTSTAYLRPQA
jgi:hypothetical protein